MKSTQLKLLILALSVLFLVADDIISSKGWNMVVVGEGYTLGLLANGTLYAWGNNSYGELGFANISSLITPHPVMPQETWKFITTKKESSYAITTDGRLFAWGYNKFGQLGIDSKEDVNFPAQVGNDSDWSMIAAGFFHALALKQNGSLFVWGSGLRGRLGTGNDSDVLSPIQIMANDTWKIISAGREHSLAIRDDFALFAWGDNTFGLLGEGSYNNYSHPVRVGEENMTYSMISAGMWHTLAIDTSGNLFSWGSNSFGQLGDNTIQNNSTDPEVPVGSNSSKWKAVSAGHWASMAIREDGSLWTFGSGRVEKVGDNINWTNVSVGFDHAFGKTTESYILGWGDNRSGQLGDGTNSSRSTPHHWSGTPGSSSSTLKIILGILVVVIVCGGIFAYFKRRKVAKEVALEAHYVSA